ncbi:MAG: N-acetylmuramidase family protein [Duncaniella sp.]|nr:N-acetylmuramidase family protein [Duncaniella sp.]
MRNLFSLLVIIIIAAVPFFASGRPNFRIHHRVQPPVQNTFGVDSDSIYIINPLTLALRDTTEQGDTIRTLTDDDFREVAERLGVEPAAIKAVVDIEAGRTHEGFYAPGKPLINFDLTMFRRFAQRRGVNLAKYSKSHSQVFTSHRGSQKRAWERLESAKTINKNAAIEGTFWGMFQIGGFNWKKCGAESIDDFVERMSRSERDQLDLFAEFITSAGLLKHLQNKNWAAFARGYNGPSYASRGYHTRMAAAYAKHLKD